MCLRSVECIIKNIHFFIFCSNVAHFEARPQKILVYFRQRNFKSIQICLLKCFSFEFAQILTKLRKTDRAAFFCKNKQLGPIYLSKAIFPCFDFPKQSKQYFWKLMSVSNQIEHKHLKSSSKGLFSSSKSK